MSSNARCISFFSALRIENDIEIISLKDNSKLNKVFKAYKAKISPQTPKYKFGVKVPQGIRRALALDQENGNSLWKEAIDKELKQINDYETFRQRKPGESLDGYTRIPYHMVFDVKFDLRRKARLVAGGNWTDPPKEDIYSRVDGMDTIRLGFQIAAMNELNKEEERRQT